MKKILYIFMAVGMLLTGMSAKADAQERYELVDSVIFRMADAADSSLYGRSILSLMPSKSKGDVATVTVKQSSAIASAMDAHVRSNSNRALKGYRVRIYFDNKQNSRNASMAVYNAFCQSHHDVPAYRTYVNPYFKVTVGDFRTKSEAMQFMARIKSEFPSAFVIKENIKSPVVDKANAFVADTIKVRRKIQ
ncbi:MAG: SPOR domain-containing protein [Bacteroidales bacterium]|nr:SPOR domain-containing protein [Candidatus Cryptobacteroides caccocaballi]